MSHLSFYKAQKQAQKKKEIQLLILQLSSFQFGEAYFKYWVSKVLSFYLEQTMYLRKFLQFFVSFDIDTLGQTCPKAPCLTSFLYVFLIGILSQEGQIRAPVTGAPALAVDSISSVLPLETCKTATQSSFLQTFDKWSYSDCAPNRHFLFFFWISAKSMVPPLIFALFSLLYLLFAIILLVQSQHLLILLFMYHYIQHTSLIVSGLTNFLNFINLLGKFLLLE